MWTFFLSRVAGHSSFLSRVASHSSFLSRVAGHSSFLSRVAGHSSFLSRVAGEVSLAKQVTERGFGSSGKICPSCRLCEAPLRLSRLATRNPPLPILGRGKPYAIALPTRGREKNGSILVTIGIITNLHCYSVQPATKCRAPCRSTGKSTSHHCDPVISTVPISIFLANDPTADGNHCFNPAGSRMASSSSPT